MSQPLFFLVVQIRRNFLIYFLMVIIQKLFVFFRHNIRIDSVQVHGDVGNGFKIHELAILILFPIAGQKLILQTDTVGAFNVDTRLVRDNHACFKRLNLTGPEGPAESGGALVDVQQITHAVSG